MLNALDKHGLGNRLTKLLRDHDLTQEKLAERLEVDVGTVGRWIRGDTTPSLNNLYALNRILDVSLDKLVLGQSNQTQSEIASLNYEIQSDGRRYSQPLISVIRPPRSEVEKIGLTMMQLLLKGMDRQAIMQDFNIQEDETFWRFIRRVVFSNILAVQLDAIPLNDQLATQVQTAYGLKTCYVVDMGGPDSGLLMMVVLGALGAKRIVELAKQSGVRLNVGFAGGFACARVIMALTQMAEPPKLDVMPIAIQQTKKVVALDANTLIGMLGFFTIGTDVRVYGLPFVSNAQLAHHDQDHAPITREMLERATKADIAFLGLGANFNYFFHRTSESDMFCQKTLYELKQMGCLGDILYTLVAKEGPMPELQGCCDERVCSIGLDGLKKMAAGHAEVIAVARGRNEAEIARLALEKRYINGLIIDRDLAEAILLARS